MSTFYNVYSAIRHPFKNEILTNGRLFIGQPWTDPTLQKNQLLLTAVHNATRSEATSQPVSLGSGGVPSVEDGPVQLTFSGNAFSMVIQDEFGNLLYSASLVNLNTEVEAAQGINQFNQYGLAAWISPDQNDGIPMTYPINSTVVFEGELFEAVRDTNTSPALLIDWIKADSRSIFDQLVGAQLVPGRLCWFSTLLEPIGFLRLDGTLYKNTRYPVLLNAGSAFVDMNPVDANGNAIPNYFRVLDMQDWLRPSTTTSGIRSPWVMRDHSHFLNYTEARNAFTHTIQGASRTNIDVINATAGVLGTPAGGSLEVPHLVANCCIYAGGVAKDVFRI